MIVSLKIILIMNYEYFILLVHHIKLILKWRKYNTSKKL